MKHATLCCLMLLLLGFSSPVFAQHRKVAYSPRPTDVPGQVQIVFKGGPTLPNLLAEAGWTNPELQRRLNGECAGGCSKVPGIESALVEKIPGHRNKWRIVINPTDKVDCQGEYRNFMDLRWTEAIKQMLPKDINLVLRGKDRLWHTKMQLKRKAVET